MKEFYIYGRPIKTEIGYLHFMTVSDYYEFINEGYMNSLIITEEDLLLNLNKLEKFDENIKSISNVLSEISLFEFLKIIENFDEVNSYVHLIGLYELYLNIKNMFKFCFKEDVFYKITNNKDFEEYRDLIMEINCIPYVKPNPNPEIEKYNQMKRLMQKYKGECIDFESMYTSVGLAFGKDPDDMTLYKFNKYFSRLAQFKSYDTTTLFATVSSDVKIEPWYKAIDDKVEAKQTISESELKDKLQKNL